MTIPKKLRFSKFVKLSRLQYLHLQSLLDCDICVQTYVQKPTIANQKALQGRQKRLLQLLLIPGGTFPETPSHGEYSPMPPPQTKIAIAILAPFLTSVKNGVLTTPFFCYRKKIVPFADRMTCGHPWAKAPRPLDYSSSFLDSFIACSASVAVSTLAASSAGAEECLELVRYLSKKNV